MLTIFEIQAVYKKEKKDERAKL